MPSTRQHTLLTVVLTAAVLVGGANLAAYAATGEPLLAGKANETTKSTKLIMTGEEPGPVLYLKNRSGKATLKVSNRAKIGLLNADAVDGLHGAELTTTPKVYTDSVLGTDRGQQYVWAFLVPAGTHQISWTVALQPSVVDVMAVCGLTNTVGMGGVTYAAESTFYDGSRVAAMAGSTVLKLALAQTVRLYCNTNAPAFSLEAFPLQIAVTKLNGSTTGGLTQEPTP